MEPVFPAGIYPAGMQFATIIFSMLLDKIRDLPSGYSEVLYRDKKYGVTRTDFNDGNSHKVYAEQLGGKDFISLNCYVTEKSLHLKPCEMPERKVTDFLNEYTSIEN